MDDLSGWAQALLALISLVGAGIAWWRSNLSRVAKKEAHNAALSAERSERRAEAHLAAVQELSANSARQAEAAELTAAEVKKINEPKGPRLSIVKDRGDTYCLRNVSRTLFRCECVTNRAEFPKLDDLDDEFTLVPGAALKFFAVGFWGAPLPTELVLDEVGSDEPVVVPMPPEE